MFSIRVVILLIGLYYRLGVAHAEPNGFQLAYTDKQFKWYSIAKQVEKASLRSCVMECLLFEPRCESFSLSSLNTCSITILPLHSGVHDSSFVFEPAIGTRIYAKTSGMIILKVIHYFTLKLSKVLRNIVTFLSSLFCISE